MAVVSNENRPFYQPYLENKKVRYGLYAISVLAIGAMAIRYGNAKVAFTFASAGTFVQGYKILKITKEIQSDIDSRENTQRISQITDRIFTMVLIWGIVLGGLNLSLIYREGSLLLKGASIDALFSKNIFQGWLNRAPSLIYHANNLASIGCFTIPQAIGFTYFSDDNFFGEKKSAAKISVLIKSALNIWISANEQTSLFSLFWLIKDMVDAMNIPTFVSKILSEAAPQLASAWTALKNVPFFSPTLKDIHHWISSFSNPKPNPLFKDSTSKVNRLFFHTLNLSLLAASLYYHRYPMLLYFGIGMFYTTSFQTEDTIKRTWEIAPDFVGMPLLVKCRYLYERLSPMNIALAWWNIPGACLSGLYLAEGARYYGRHFFNG